MMRKVKATIFFTLVLGSIQYFGIQQYYFRYFDVNIKYMAESAPVQRGQVQRPFSTPTTTPPRAVASPVNCIANAEQDWSDPGQAVGKHPVSRLYEIQAKNHENEPIFTDVGERGQQIRNNVEFQVQVTVNGKKASAWGHTKKDAKRRAAVEMLTLMRLPVEDDQSNSVLHSC